MLLRNTKGLQYIINERLAKKSGLIGSLGRALEIGPRQYGAHVLPRFFKVANYHFIYMLYLLSASKNQATRFIYAGYGHMPITHTLYYITLIWGIFALFCIGDMKKFQYFYDQDGPKYWYVKFKLSFPA